MTLNRRDFEQPRRDKLSTERNSTFSSGSYGPGKQLPAVGLHTHNYYSDSDSGIFAPPNRASTKIRPDCSQCEPERMSPKDRAHMLETEDNKDVLTNESILSAGEESDFWTYDDQSLLSEESVRRSCQQIYNTIQQNGESQPHNHDHEQRTGHHMTVSSRCRESVFLQNRESAYDDGSTRSTNSARKTPVSTLPRKGSNSVPKMCIQALIPGDIVRVYARPASVVPVQDTRRDGESFMPSSRVRNSQQYYQTTAGLNRHLATAAYPPHLTTTRNHSDSSRISLVSMDQVSWKNSSSDYRMPFHETQMFKSQPCLTSSTPSSSLVPYNYQTLPGNASSQSTRLYHSFSDNTISTNVSKGRRGASSGAEAFGNLNEKNRTQQHGQSAEQNESKIDAHGERPSRANQCRRSKSFAEKIHRGSLSFRSACSAFRRAFSQERIYRPEKQERQQQEFMNSTMEGKQNKTETENPTTPSSFGKEDRSPLVSSGRHIVNGIREKLGGGKEIFANCNSYPSKLAIHRRKPKHCYQPPQLISTHANASERDSEKGSDVVDGTLSYQEDYGVSTNGGWFTDPSNSDYNQQVRGHLIQLNVDGSQVIELSRPRGFHFGFFVARGRVKDTRGVFVSRMRDVLTQKILAGILEVGDEILEIEGVDVRGADILNVNSMMANKQNLLLTVLPYISRKDI